MRRLEFVILAGGYTSIWTIDPTGEMAPSRGGVGTRPSAAEELLASH